MASALVSGGASGLGAATVRLLAGRGYDVVVFDRDEAGGSAVADEVGGRFVGGDVTVTDDVGAAVAAAPDLRVAVSTAGIGIAERTLGGEGMHDLDRFERVLRVNLIGTFDVLRRAAAAMAANEADAEGERGVIVNTASVAAYEPQIGQAAYGASKGGVVTLTLAAARDLSRSGIRVVTIAPGTFETPLLRGLPPEAIEKLEAATPFPARLGRPEEYAALVGHIVDNRMLNGETIRLDGALRMGPR